jgi:hypothetical protein
MPTAPRNSIPSDAGGPPRYHPLSSAQVGARLNGFERPHYFAGHLLTDADLMLEQHYFREKTRLYQRTLHGHGIVCGLRLTCDFGYPGGILVGRGYAIDDCGNDLIVTEPVAFDVVERLRDKRLIFEPPPADRRQLDEGAMTEGDLRQCFYITISYQEEQTNFSTPLMGTQQSVASECEPTRVRETVYPDAVGRLSERQHNPDALKRRVESCFKLFSEGDFAQTFQRGQKLLDDLITAAAEPSEEHRKLFSDLRRFLLLYLGTHRDQYNRTIDQDIRNVPFPVAKNGAEKPSGKQVADAFASLLSLAWHHVVSSALGEFVPSCHEPATPDSVVLGAVVVENGRVVRVCNSPRSYVWSAASFPEQLLAMTFNGSSRFRHENEVSESGEEEAAGMACCRQFNFDLECFLKWLKVSPNAPFYSSTELLHWIESIGKSIREGFDFTNPCNFSTRIFEKWDQGKATEFLKTIGISSRARPARLDTRAPHPLAVMQAAGLSTEDQTIVLTVETGVVTDAVAEPSNLLTQIDYLQSQINSLKVRLDGLQGQEPQSGPGQRPSQNPPGTQGGPTSRGGSNPPTPPPAPR